MSAALTWDLLDADAPRGIRVPFVTGPCCLAAHPNSGMKCTRHVDHYGRHAAAGTIWDGWRLVLAVWS